MKRTLLSAVLVLTAVAGSAFAQEKKDVPTARFVLPPPRPLNWSKPVKCIGVASASLFKEDLESDDFNRHKLSVYIKKGADRLRLWLEGDNLVVQVGDQKPDRYHVTGHRNGFLVAIYYGGLIPAADSISLDEKTGFAAWSLNEPILVPVSEYPYAQTVYMHCTN